MRGGVWSSLIEQTRVIERILTHLGLPTEIPTPEPARVLRDHRTFSGHVSADETLFEQPC